LCIEIPTKVNISGFKIWSTWMLHMSERHVSTFNSSGRSYYKVRHQICTCIDVLLHALKMAKHWFF